ncbi:MAG: hypothetical protein LBH81_00740 [Rickettsiales bacterium]|nr:hypothetical protein [Rickettsiales bacterium]
MSFEYVQKTLGENLAAGLKDGSIIEYNISGSGAQTYNGYAVDYKHETVGLHGKDYAKCPNILEAAAREFRKKNIGELDGIYFQTVKDIGLYLAIYRGKIHEREPFPMDHLPVYDATSAIGAFTVVLDKMIMPWTVAAFWPDYSVASKKGLPDVAHDLAFHANFHSMMRKYKKNMETLER